MWLSGGCGDRRAFSMARLGVTFDGSGVVFDSTRQDEEGFGIAVAVAASGEPFPQREQIDVQDIVVAQFVDGSAGVRTNSMNCDKLIQQASAPNVTPVLT